MSTTRYQVHLEAYEGPIDLLLHLVSKHEVDIYDISIEALTGQYMEYLETFKELNIPLASEFLVMASQLLYIKSRALLPRDLSGPDDEPEDDPRWDLIRQLLEYKKFKEAANHLRHSQRQRTDLYGKAFSLLPTEHSPPELQQVSTLDLFHAFQTAVKRYQESTEVGQITDDMFNVSDKIEYVLSVLQQHGERTFTALAEACHSKQELIVTFLAILELTKLNQLHIRQDTYFSELYLSLPST